MPKVLTTTTTQQILNKKKKVCLTCDNLETILSIIEGDFKRNGDIKLSHGIEK